VGVGADLVVNCAGLGARELIGDHALYPVRGQIVRVTNPGLTLSVRDEQHPGGRAYVHPRRDDCILGGTLDEGRWDTTVDMAVGAAIIERCWDLVPALRDARVLEQLSSGARVIHNYGHGGAGVTLSWGCAREVVSLI
jgi:D-amino-acid oxidase